MLLAQVGPKQFDMRFWDPKSSAFDIEATLVMNVVAGPPTTWQLSPIEGEAGSGVAVSEEGSWTVKCGQEFTVALELSDEFGNRCAAVTPPAALIEQHRVLICVGSSSLRSHMLCGHFCCTCHEQPSALQTRTACNMTVYNRTHYPLLPLKSSTTHSPWLHMISG